MRVGPRQDARVVEACRRELASAELPIGSADRCSSLRHPRPQVAEHDVAGEHQIVDRCGTQLFEISDRFVGDCLRELFQARLRSLSTSTSAPISPSPAFSSQNSRTIAVTFRRRPPPVASTLRPISPTPESPSCPRRRSRYARRARAAPCRCPRCSHDRRRSEVRDWSPPGPARY